ncbi:peptidase S24/S26A/S26B/S26C [Mycena maculata]|uniref:Mitochondrial inner membrane protease subunit 2 n=1 Tax=Mycena maculata TaxID=230809 RepID=A0AAD7N1L9_9AGAR|nr:peptidase S24/S26A/S26B/S26C [Mycena maculata]
MTRRMSEDRVSLQCLSYRDSFTMILLLGQFSRAWPVLYWLPTTILLTDFYTLKQVNGRSMQPTLNPNESLLWRDVAIFDRFSIHTLQCYRRGDIVALKSPHNAKHELVKRISAVEGDIVRTLPPYPEPEVRVPKGHIWVEGDAFHSQDSNSFGPVPLGLIDSRLVSIIWPFWRFRSSTVLTTAGSNRRVTPANNRST